MKRFAGFCALVSVLVFVCGSHLAFSVPPGPPPKMKICHVDGNGNGTVLMIAQPATRAHCKNHDGDWTGGAMLGDVGQSCEPKKPGDTKTCPTK